MSCSSIHQRELVSEVIISNQIKANQTEIANRGKMMCSLTMIMQNKHQMNKHQAPSTRSLTHAHAHSFT